MGRKMTERDAIKIAILHTIKSSGGRIGTEDLYETVIREVSAVRNHLLDLTDSPIQAVDSVMIELEMTGCIAPA